MFLTVTFTFQVENQKKFRLPRYDGPTGVVRYNDGTSSKNVMYGEDMPGAVLGSGSLAAEVDIDANTEVRYQTTERTVPGGMVTVTEPFVRITDGVPVRVIPPGHPQDSYWAPGLVADWAPLWPAV